MSADDKGGVMGDPLERRLGERIDELVAMVKELEHGAELEPDALYAAADRLRDQRRQWAAALGRASHEGGES